MIQFVYIFRWVMTDEFGFAGFLISADGVKPIKKIKMTEAIPNFQIPTNIAGVRS